MKVSWIDFKYQIPSFNNMSEYLQDKPETQSKNRIPFYIYESTHDTDFFNLCDPHDLQNHSTDQNGDDLQFIYHLQKHPWRTWNPQQAKIFIIPLPLNFIVKQNKDWHFSHQHNDKGHCGDQHIYTILDKYVRRILQTPTFLKNYGHDHLLVASDWRLRRLTDFPVSVYTLLKNITIANYERQMHHSFQDSGQLLVSKMWSRTLISPYVEKSLLYKHPEIITSVSTFEHWKQRNIDILFMGRVLNSHRGYRFRYAINKHLATTFKSLAEHSNQTLPTYIFGSKGKLRNNQAGPICICDQYRCSNCQLDAKTMNQYEKYLLDSKFGLIIQGDTPTTSRFYDAVANYQIPIIISKYTV